MRSVFLISVFAIAIGAAAASDCDLLLDQFDAAADACALSCYGEGSVQREGLVEIAEVRHHVTSAVIDAGKSNVTMF